MLEPREIYESQSYTGFPPWHMMREISQIDAHVSHHKLEIGDVIKTPENSGDMAI